MERRIQLTILLIISSTAINGQGNGLGGGNGNGNGSGSRGISLISYGVYLNKCSDYCSSSIEVQPQQHKLIAIKSPAPDRSDVMKLKNENSLAYNDWRELVGLIHMTRFRELPSVVGCSSCFEEGGEWIEIVFDGNPKRVNFALYRTIPDFEKLISKLRILRMKYADDLTD